MFFFKASSNEIDDNLYQEGEFRALERWLVSDESE